MALKQDHADIAAMSFEAALKELETIVKKLEAGQGELETAIADYARGAALKDHCLKKLQDARLKVEKIVKTSSGELKTELLDEAS